MDILKKILTWLSGQKVAVKILVAVAAAAVACALVFSSCSTFRNATVGGYHKVDKNTTDSLYYESSFQK